MKRIIAILLAAVLTIGVASVAFAAESPAGGQTDSVISSVSGDVTKDEIEWTSNFSYSDADVLAAAQKLGIDTSNAQVGVKGDLHMKSGKPFTGTATITFNVSDVIAVLHLGGEWEKVGDSATATFHSFSPVAILVKKAPAADQNQNQNQKQDQKSDQKSPATGEVPFVAGMAFIAVLAVAGIVISRKKSAE